jgi:hypothetical protein
MSISRLPKGKCSPWAQHARYNDGANYLLGTADERTPCIFAEAVARKPRSAEIGQQCRKALTPKQAREAGLLID